MAHLLSDSRRLRGRFGDERGVGVPAALAVAMITFFLGATWMQLSQHNLQTSSHERGREQALHAAEAGVNQAMSRLTIDAAYAGESGTLPDGAGEYEITVEPVDPSNPDDNRRLIKATAWSPSKDAARAVTREMEAEVDLESTDGFDFSVFAGNGGLTVGNRLESQGDVYSAAQIDAGNNSEVLGDVKAVGSVTFGRGSVIEGSIYSDGDVFIGNNAVVQGSIYAGGNVTLENNAVVEGDVQSGGTVSIGDGAVVGGGVAENSPPPPVLVESLPEFTWDPANYPSAISWTSTSAFRDDWSADVNAGLPYSGHHRINDTATLDLDLKWKMDGDMTIVADGPVHLEREITNATSGTVDLVIVSTHENGILVKNGVTIPDSIRVLFFAPNGLVEINNNKHLAGAFYGQQVTVRNDMDITYAAPDAPGFSWVAATDVKYRVLVRVLRDVTGFETTS